MSTSHSNIQALMNHMKGSGEMKEVSANPPERAWCWMPGYEARHVIPAGAADGVTTIAHCGERVIVDLDEVAWLLPTCPSCYRLVAGAPTFEALRAGQR